MKKESDEDPEEGDEEEDFEESGEEEDEESEIEEIPLSKKPISDIDFNNLDFSQFTPSVGEISNSTSPSLESIESRIDTPGFVSMGNFSSQSGSNLESSGGDTYLTSQGQGDGGSEVKYIQSAGDIKTNLERVDMQTLGRDVGGLNIPQPGNFFISSEPGGQPRNEHVGMQPERLDIQNIGRKNPLEREELKYEDQKKYES